MLRSLPLLVLFAAASWTASPARAADASPESQAELNQSLLSMEEQVDSLKEQVFRAKATLQLLNEIVAAEPTGRAQAVVWYENKLGSGYTIERITVLLDGQARFARDEDANGTLTSTKELKVLEGPIGPGDHALSVEVRLRPTGYGIFKYAKNYVLDVRSSYAFNVDVGRTCTVRGTLNEKGAAQNFEERAQMEYELRCERNADATSK